MPKRLLPLDSADYAILKELQVDARTPNSDLAPKVGLSTSARLIRASVCGFRERCRLTLTISGASQ